MIIAVIDLNWQDEYTRIFGTTDKKDQVILGVIKETMRNINLLCHCWNHEINADTPFGILIQHFLHMFPYDLEAFLSMLGVLIGSRQCCFSEEIVAIASGLPKITIDFRQRGELEQIDNANAQKAYANFAFFELRSTSIMYNGIEIPQGTTLIQLNTKDLYQAYVKVNFWEHIFVFLTDFIT